MRSLSKAVLLSAGMLLLSGCANEMTGYNYSASGTRQVQTVDYGQVTQIQMVKIDGSKSGVGALGGAAAGGIAGSSIGGGTGSMLGAVGGALIGGIAGSAIEGATTSAQGVNLFVRLCSGRTISVVQQLDKNNPIRIGDPVSVLSSGNMTRVTYDPNSQCSNLDNRQYHRRGDQRNGHHRDDQR